MGDSQVGSTRRRWLAVVVMTVAGVASLGTGAGPGQLAQKAQGQVAFTRDDRVEIRHARVTVTARSMNASSHADIRVATGGIGSPSKLPIMVAMIRDSDGASIGRDYGPGYEAQPTGNFAYQFVPIARCAADTTCTESFTVTFTWLDADQRDSLAFDWTMNVWADNTLPASARPADVLTVEISE